MTRREAVDHVNPDLYPGQAAFIIAGFLRTVVQGEPSTFEGECASLNAAAKHYDLRSGDGIRAWPAALGGVPDIPAPTGFWLNMLDADRRPAPQLRDKWRNHEADKWKECSDRIEKMVRRDYPPTVAAHLFVNVWMPRLMKIIGIKPCVEEVVRWLAERVCEHAGVCAVCKAVPSTNVEMGTCDKCTAEIDAMCADADEGPFDG